ncbi:MAG: glycoside hydrolase family 28 protein [Bacteroidales bacterium]|nr:glycoside hydrolase family 28 protein [Bacteroidales bacterium]
MNLKTLTTYCFLAVLPLLSACGSGNGKVSAREDLPFDMPEVRLPSIPHRSVVLTDFGAVGDGTFLNTEAFASAIRSLSGQGGGRLVVPAGIWFTGPIALESRIELHLEPDAVIVFSSDRTLYPVIETNFEGLDVRRCTSPIHAEGATDIAITGSGVIDGGGAPWREVKKRKVSSDQWNALLKKGGVLAEDGSAWYPDEGYRKARLTAGTLNYPDPSLDEQEILTFLRPVMVSLRECERILLEGCTFQNSPCWNLHPLYCKDLTVRSVNVRNPHYSANGDGIDIDACERVSLTGSTFDVGDDAICIKSGKDEDGRRHGRACKDIYISDCTVYHGHGGFVVGSEMSGGVENIVVRHCRFLGTDVGLRFKSTRGRGGLVKNIWCDHIYMKDIVSDAVIFNLYYAGVAASDRADGAAGGDLVPVDETTPEMRDIHFSDIVCSGAARAVTLNGLPELPLRGISFRDCVFTAGKGVESVNAVDVVFENVTVNGEKL